MRTCLDVTPEYSDGLAAFVEVMATAKEPMLRGMQRYHDLSLRLGFSGVRDFEDLFVGSYKVGGQLVNGADVCRDLFSIIDELDGVFTERALEKLVKQLWQGQALVTAPPFPPDWFDATMGVFYTARDFVSRLDSKKGILILAEVREALPYSRRADLLVVSAKSGENAANFTKVLPENVIASVEVKWYLPTTEFRGERIISEVENDLRRALDRDHNFNILYFAFPDDYPADQLAGASDLIMDVFNTQTVPYLRTVGWEEEDILFAGDVLLERLNTDMFLLVPSS